VRLLPFAAAVEDPPPVRIRPRLESIQGPGRPIVPTPPRSPTAFGSHAGDTQARSEHRTRPRLCDAPHGASNLRSSHSGYAAPRPRQERGPALVIQRIMSPALDDFLHRSSCRISAGRGSIGQAQERTATDRTDC
jgi:hypothetical protein